MLSFRWNICIPYYDVLIFEALQEVWLDKISGRVCMSISARALSITGIEDRRYWNWIPTEESRFEILKLISVDIVFPVFYVDGYMQRIFRYLWLSSTLLYLKHKRKTYATRIWKICCVIFVDNLLSWLPSSCVLRITKKFAGLDKPSFVIIHHRN